LSESTTVEGNGAGETPSGDPALQDPALEGSALEGSESKDVADSVADAVEPNGQPSSDDLPVSKMFTILHPLGWVALGFGVLAIIATAAGSDLLIGRLPLPLWGLVAATVISAAIPGVLHAIRIGIEAVSDFAGKIAMILAWAIFALQLFNVVTRYTNSWFEQDILFGETTSLAWMSFAMLFLFGVAQGVKNGINPRIDFWWAEFSKRRKAWLDFVLHCFLLLPFLMLGLRLLWQYSRTRLGYNEVRGEWPNGFRVWDSWVTAENAGELPPGPVQAFIIVGVALWTAQVVAEIIKTGYVIAGDERRGDIAESDVPLRVE